MGHRLPLLAASIGLVLGGTLAAASPAGAVASPAGWVAQPGGLMGLSTGTQPAGGRSQVTRTTATSINWAGYAATGGPFTSVSADWVQPAGTCGRGNTYASFWVGLDGYSSRSVEQTGTEVDCIGGTAEYYAWWELYPGPATEIHTVGAGDAIAASVTYQGNNVFRLSLHDITEGWTYTTGPKLPGAAAARSSAEVIAEAPSSQGGVLPLANFGTVSFTAAVVNSTQNLGSTSPVQIDMEDGSASVSVSGFTDNNENFTATYSGSGPGYPGPFVINGG